MGSKGPSRVPRKWFSGGLGIVFGHFLMHLGTRLKRKSTVAEQRGCALDNHIKNSLSTRTIAILPPHEHSNYDTSLCQELADFLIRK